MPILSGNKYRVPFFANGINYSNTDVQILNYWVVASRDNMMVRVSDGLIESSQDSGETWTNNIAFTDADKIDWGYLYPNGNCSLATNDRKIYLTTVALLSVDEITVKDTDGITDYDFHTPANASYVGSYFHVTQHMESTTAHHVLAPYGNTPEMARGASAMTIPFTPDYGASWKMSYKFGQNLVYEDDGTATGSDAGTTLGDSGNSIVVRHGHTNEYNPYNQKYYYCSGDHIWTYTTPDMEEIQWMEGTWNAMTEQIDYIQKTFTGINPIPRTSRLKAGGMFFVGEYIYWGSDANPVTVPDEQGLWRSKMSTFFTDPSSHERVFPLYTNETILATKVDPNTNRLLCVIVDNVGGTINTLLAIENFGHGNISRKIINTTSVNPPFLMRLNSPNDKGYFRVDCGDEFGNLLPQTLMIKVGNDLFWNV